MVLEWSLLLLGVASNLEELQEVSRRGRLVPQIQLLVTVMQDLTTIIALNTLPVHSIILRKYFQGNSCQPQWARVKVPLVPRQQLISPQHNQHPRRLHCQNIDSICVTSRKTQTLNCLLTFIMSNGTVLRTSWNLLPRRKSKTDWKNLTHLPLKITLTLMS